jgi:hypothetical protein
VYDITPHKTLKRGAGLAVIRGPHFKYSHASRMKAVRCSHPMNQVAPRALNVEFNFEVFRMYWQAPGGYGAPSAQHTVRHEMQTDRGNLLWRRRAAT